MSYFKSKAEQLAESTVSLNPAIQSGWLVMTKDVIGHELQKNPYFLSMSGICQFEGQQMLKTDAIKDGISIMIKDLSASRSEKVLLNPKYAHHLTFGSSTGKLGEMETEDKSAALGDVAFSGNNNQLPTLFGMQLLPKEILKGSQSTARDVANNVSQSDQAAISGTIPGTIPPWPVSGPNDPDVRKINGTGEGDRRKLERPPDSTHYGQQYEGTTVSRPKGAISKKLDDLKRALDKNPQAPAVDPKTGKTQVSNWTGKGMTGNSIVTGTGMLPNSELSSIVWG
jgi:hypothetical protein